MSEGNVYQLIAAVASDMASEGIGKDRKNEQQGYKFRGIDDVYNALAPMMARHGLVILPRCVSRECIERTSAKGSPLFNVVVEAEFDFVSSHDSTLHTVRTFGEAMDSADKATNKAMSAAYKYAAFQTFCIPTEGDNDADATTHEVKPRAARPVQAPPTVAKMNNEDAAEAAHRALRESKTAGKALAPVEIPGYAAPPGATLDELADDSARHIKPLCLAAIAAHDKTEIPGLRKMVAELDKGFHREGAERWLALAVVMLDVDGMTASGRRAARGKIEALPDDAPHKSEALDILTAKEEAAA